MFENRTDAGQQLANLLSQKIKGKNDLVVVSLLRGGLIVGYEIAKKLKLSHFGLPVVKISAPDNEELAIGALIFKVKFYHPQTSFGYKKESLIKSEKKALEKFESYCLRFKIKEIDFNSLANKTVILVDDGAATGSSLRTAALFLKQKKVKKIILALPVACSDFDTREFDSIYILHQDPHLSAVSQYYQDFSQVDEEIVKRFLK